MNSPWRELGLPGPSDMETIKRAYAQRIKEVHPEEDPEGFQALHRAYQMARRMATDRQPRRPSFQSPEVRPEPQETPAESEDLDFSALEDGEEEPPEDAEPGRIGFFLGPEDQEKKGRNSPRTGTLRSCWRRTNRRTVRARRTCPIRRRNMRLYGAATGKSARLDKVMLVLAMLVLLLLVGPAVLPGIVERVQQNTYPKTILRQMEEDWGVELVSSPQNNKREELRYLYLAGGQPGNLLPAIYGAAGTWKRGSWDTIPIIPMSFVLAAAGVCGPVARVSAELQCGADGPRGRGRVGRFAPVSVCVPDAHARR